MMGRTPCSSSDYLQKFNQSLPIPCKNFPEVFAALHSKYPLEHIAGDWLAKLNRSCHMHPAGSILQAVIQHKPDNETGKIRIWKFVPSPPKLSPSDLGCSPRNKPKLLRVRNTPSCVTSWDYPFPSILLARISSNDSSSVVLLASSRSICSNIDSDAKLYLFR